MEVLYDHQMFSIQRFGGITRIFVELARELSRSPECSIHWYRGIHSDGYEVGDFRRRLARYWAFPWPSGKKRRDRLNRVGFGWFVRTSRRPYDIYHPSYYGPSLAPVAGSKRLVVTVYDMILEKLLTGLERFRPVAAEKRRLVEAADLVFAISHSTARDLAEIIPASRDKTQVTHIASRLSDAPTAALPAALEGRPYFLYVGTRSKYKNFEVLLRAFAGAEWLKSAFRV